MTFTDILWSMTSCLFELIRSWMLLGRVLDAKAPKERDFLLERPDVPKYPGILLLDGFFLAGDSTSNMSWLA